MGRQGGSHLKNHHAFTGMPNAPCHLDGLILNHLDVSGRLQHVAGLADSLETNTAMLRAEGCKTPLLTKVSQESSRKHPSADASASLPDNRPRVGDGATRAAVPSTERWFDPGENKKAGLVSHCGFI